MGPGATGLLVEWHKPFKYKNTLKVCRAGACEGAGELVVVSSIDQSQRASGPRHLRIKLSVTRANCGSSALREAYEPNEGLRRQ